jgi:hypothetical protein
VPRFPKFVNDCGIPDTNFGNKGGRWQNDDFSAAFRFDVPDSNARSLCGNIKPAALGTERKQTLAGLSNPK